MRKNYYFIAVLFLIFTSCNGEKSTNHLINAPVAKKQPKSLTIHNDTRIDDYFWMRLSDEQKNAKTPDKQTQDVLNYLNAENDYLNKTMKHTEAFQLKLYNEINK